MDFCLLRHQSALTYSGDYCLHSLKGFLREPPTSFRALLLTTIGCSKSGYLTRDRLIRELLWEFWFHSFSGDEKLMCWCSVIWRKAACSERGRERGWGKQEWKANVLIAFGSQISVDPESLPHPFSSCSWVAIYMPQHPSSAFPFPPKPDKLAIISEQGYIDQWTREKTTSLFIHLYTQKLISSCLRYKWIKWTPLLNGDKVTYLMRLLWGYLIKQILSIVPGTTSMMGYFCRGGRIYFKILNLALPYVRVLINKHRRDDGH